jgi:hypothetical protein
MWQIEAFGATATGNREKGEPQEHEERKVRGGEGHTQPWWEVRV